MAHKTTFLAGLIFLLSSLLFAQGELYGPVYIIGDDGRLYIDNIPDTVTASYLAVIDDGWLKKLDIDNLELDTSNIAGLYDYLNAKSDTGHVHDTADVTGLHDMLAGKSDVDHDHDTGDVNNLSLYLGQKLDIADTSDLARKIHGDRHLPGGPDDFFPSGTGGFLHYGDGVAQPTSWEWRYPAVADVTGLQSTLDLKLNISDTSVFVRDPELDDYYTKTNLSTSGQSSVHWNNITNEPAFITGVDWDEITGTQSLVDVSGFNNDAGYLTSLPSHDHDSRYPLKSLGYVRPEFTHEAMETDRVTLADGMYTYSWFSSALNRPADCLFGSALTFGGSVESQGKAQLLIGWSSSYENYIGFRSLRNVTDPWSSIKRIYHEGYKPQWDDIGSKPSVFPPEDHNHSATDITSGTLSNDRLSFNPDYFVQGENSSRTIHLNSNRRLDETMYSMFFLLNSDDPANPSENFLYGFRTVNTNLSSPASIEIAGRANTGELYFGGFQGSTRRPWREIWHSGNLDTANIVRRNANNVFTGVNTFSDTVKAAQIKPVNSNFIRIDLGQDVKNYGVTFRHIDAPYGQGSIGMYAKSFFDIKSDGLMQLISGEKVCIEGGDSVSISKNANTIKMLMTTDNKVTIGKVQDTVLPLDHDLTDTLMLGRKYGIGVLGFGGTDDLVGGDSPNIFGYSYAFQAAPSLAGNLTYTATKHNFNGDIVYGGNPQIIHSEFENIGSNDQTLNPTKGVYICFGSTTGQEITLGTTGVENGQTVKILKASILLTGVRYGEPGKYQWRSIGHFGAAEFIHYNGVWFCHGTEYKP